MTEPDAGHPEDHADRGLRPPEAILEHLVEARIRELRQVGDVEGAIRWTAALGRAIELLRTPADEDHPEYPE